MKNIFILPGLHLVEAAGRLPQAYEPIKRSFKAVFRLLLLILLAVPVYAQQELSLSQAIEMGLQNNFDIRIEEQNVAIAENNNEWGEAGRWPLLSFEATQSNNIRDVENPASFLQGQVLSNDITPAVRLNWNLFGGFRVNITKERLQLLQEQSVGNATIVVENAIQGIVQAYYTVLLEKERLDVLQTIFNLSKDRYNYQQTKSEIGSAVTFDVLQAKSAYLTDSSNYVTQEVNYLNAERNLNLLLAVDLEQAFVLTTPFEVERKSYDLDDLYNKMVSNNSNLRNQFINLEIFRKDVNISKAELYPSLALNAGASYGINRQDLGNADLGGRRLDEPVNVAKTLNYNATFTLSYTLFNGGRIKRQIENAYTNERIAQLQVENLKLSLENQLRSAYDLYDARQRLLNITEENLESGQLNLNLAEERFKNGIINSFDFRTIQNDYLNIALNNLQAKFNAIDTNLELIRLTGGLIQEYE